MLAAAYSTIKYQSSLKSRYFMRLRLLESSASWSGSNVSRSISTTHGFDYTKILQKEPPELDYLDYGLKRDCTQGDYQTFCEKFLMESEPTKEAFLKVFFSTPTVYNPEFLQKSQSGSILTEDRILKDEQQIINTLPFKALSDLSFKEYQIRMEEIQQSEMSSLIDQEYKNFKELFLQSPNGAGYTKGQMLTTLIDTSAFKNYREVNTEEDVARQFQSKLLTPIENVFELSGHSDVSINYLCQIPLRDPRRTRNIKRADFENQLKKKLIIGEIKHHFDSLESELQGTKELSKKTLESITQCVRYCALSHCEYGFLTSLTETLLIQIDYDKCNYMGTDDDNIIQIRYYYLKNMDEKVTMKALMMSILMKQLKNTKSDNSQELQAYNQKKSENFLNFLLKSDRQFESDFQDMKNELALKMKPIGETFTLYVDHKSIKSSTEDQVLTFKIRKSDLIGDATADKAEETIVRIFDPMTMKSPYDEVKDNIDFSRNCYLSVLESLEYLDGSNVNKPVVVKKGFIIIRDRLNNNVLASGQFIAYALSKQTQQSSDVYSKQTLADLAKEQMKKLHSRGFNVSKNEIDLDPNQVILDEKNRVCLLEPLRSPFFQPISQEDQRNEQRMLDEAIAKRD
ncbi:hypothetical protein WICANDRAFT_77144 [Wickerhamomyces anomalus NRRL Y-366-8]|uniref:Uncharacterized protein n=1 Tax=Wickerhamomyces anomalus (strain ATCC 58044 / CBS 1984 / NCYC 433 / NRRL Y-366-8) TaxID=683960 RepID=A0A1E3PC46_WICAA|nr:uncharacterized protein WICANDRAFT_77144 [Wickerhamomyces anomalus NRRL Y-366-8]ODQ62986.1 hypothetical protein WICANDRAFT_77144 [Wickerhamomyces anomalus NRRL Y-366-8]